MKENFKESLNNKMLQPTIKHSYIKTKGGKRGMREGEHMTGCELKKCYSLQSQDKLWSDLKNLFSSYLPQLREVRKREELTLSLISWASLSPAGNYNIAAALSPCSKADTHPLSASSTDCHSSCQSTAIYLGARGLLEREDGGR